MEKTTKTSSYYDHQNQKFGFHDGENTMLCQIPPSKPYLLLETIAGCSPATGLLRAYKTKEQRDSALALIENNVCWIGDLNGEPLRPVEQTAPNVH